MTIVFLNNNQISTITPSDEWLELYGIDLIAKKDTPAGKPYKLIPPSYIEGALQYPQEVWEIDFSEPDGYGLSKAEFDEKYPQYSWMAVNE